MFKNFSSFSIFFLLMLLQGSWTEDNRLSTRTRMLFWEELDLSVLLGDGERLRRLEILELKLFDCLSFGARVVRVV